MRVEIEEIVNSIEKIPKKPTFYDGGSKKKHTMIKESFDQDLLLYYDADVGINIDDIFGQVYKALSQSRFKGVYPKNVAIRIPIRDDFHIDVVPTKRISGSDDDAFLWRSKDGKKKKTSLEKHLGSVQDFGRYDIIRLLKYWKARNNIPCPSFLLEQIAIESLKNENTDKIMRSVAIKKVLEFIHDKFLSRNIKDPANPNNSLISEDVIDDQEKQSLVDAAKLALDLDLETVAAWKEIFRKKAQDIIPGSPGNTFSGVGIKQRTGKVHPDAPNAGRFG